MVRAPAVVCPVRFVLSVRSSIPPQGWMARRCAAAVGAEGVCYLRYLASFWTCPLSGTRAFLSTWGGGFSFPYHQAREFEVFLFDTALAPTQSTYVT